MSQKQTPKKNRPNRAPTLITNASPNSTPAKEELFLPQIGWLLLAGAVARKLLWPGSGFFPHNLPDESGNQWTVALMGDDGYRVTCERASFRKHQLSCDIHDRERDLSARAQHLRAAAGEPMGITPTERMRQGIASLSHGEMMQDAQYAALVQEIARMKNERESYVDQYWTFPLEGELRASFNYVPEKGKEIVYGKVEIVDRGRDEEQGRSASSVGGTGGNEDSREETQRSGEEGREDREGSEPRQDAEGL